MRTATLAVALSLVLPSVVLGQRLGPTFTPLPQPTFGDQVVEHFAVDSTMSPELVAMVRFRLAPEQIGNGSCDDDRTHGRADAASTHRSGGWFWGGVGSGLLLSILGTGIITAVGASSDPQPKEVPAGYDPACYRDGYQSKAKSKNTVSALTGGLVGTAVWVLIYSATY